MTEMTAITGPRLFDGETWRENHALLVQGGRIAGLAPIGSLPEGADIRHSSAAAIAPGFIDLQVNGGGGVLLNDDPCAETIQTICAAHAKFGTTALLPTLITDTPAVTEQAIASAITCEDKQVPGFLGLHLEGPHLSQARKGAHDGALVRPMEREDLERLLSAKQRLNNLMTTIAPESVTPDQVAELSQAGIIVSLGHTDTSCRDVAPYVQAGASLTTHLFNAMSGFNHRDPGLVGATLHTGALSAGLIADGYHVDPVAIDVALRAKAGPGRIFLVSDAMSTIGTNLKTFELNGRTIFRKDGRLTLEDGTLAGADIDLGASVRFLIDTVGVSADEALRMASLYPANAIGLRTKGRLINGYDADFVEFTGDFVVTGTWVGGDRVYGTTQGMDP